MHLSAKVAATVSNISSQAREGAGGRRGRPLIAKPILLRNGSDENGLPTTSSHHRRLTKRLQISHPSGSAVQRLPSNPNGILSHRPTDARHELLWVALRYPEHFHYCLSQSGAFWWNDEFFTKTAPQRAPADTRFWLSVGDQETEVDETPPGSPPEVSQIVGVNNACRVLKSLGATVQHHEYQGGHSMPCWRDELKQALTWLLADGNQ